MLHSKIRVLSSEVLEKKKSLEEEDVIVVAGRGAQSETAWLCAGNWRKPWEASWPLPVPWWKMAGGIRPIRSAFPQNGAAQADYYLRRIRRHSVYVLHEQFGLYCAINENPEAQIFKIAHYCLVDDLYQVVPRLTELLKTEGGLKNGIPL